MACLRGNSLNIVDLGLKTWSVVRHKVSSSPLTTRANAFELSPSGQFLAVTARNGAVIVEMSSGRIVQRFQGPPRVSMSAVKFFSDGRMLAVGGIGGYVALWDLALDKQVAAFYVKSPASGANLKQSTVSDLAFSTDGKLLAAGACDSTMMIWDVEKYMHPSRLVVPKELVQDPWPILSGDDSIDACHAQWLLSFGGDEVVAALAEHLVPASKADVNEMKRLIEDLGAAKFAVREEAYKRLADLGPKAEALMKQALATKPYPEVTIRLEKLLSGTNRAVVSAPALLGAIRAIGVLERIASNRAITILKTLAAGADDSRLTKDAAGALARLGK
ncbi:MAG TPA: hypothetical protein ENL03_03190 [Phycisphaerae bacterium]|nr:hypothetical protein [Phycisphaerae bacterium]